MGIDIRARLIFGTEYKKLSELENLDEMLDDGDIDSASPYYDSDRSYWIVGVEMFREVKDEDEMIQALRKAKTEFERLTNGAIGRVIVAADVT